MLMPKWKRISKQNYTRLKDNPICDVKAVPIFEKGSGIIEQMKGKAKIIGYEYYIRVGFEQVLFVGSEQAKILYNLYKQNEQQIL